MKTAKADLGSFVFNASPAGSLEPGRTALVTESPLPGHDGVSLVVTGARAVFPAGTLFGESPDTPVFQAVRAGWRPGGEPGGPAARCVWLKTLACVDLKPEGNEFYAWTRGVSLARVTMSDKGAAGLREDRSGPLIARTLKEHVGLGYEQSFVIPDSVSEIKALLTDLALVQGFDLILTTGGTGLAPRDVTPEATLAVIEKRLEGFERAMTRAGLEKTPHAVISRAVVGTLGRSIVLNLPGSPKAVVENLAAVAAALGHALNKLKGDPGDCGR